MSYSKISDLPAGGSVASTDLFESSQGAGAPYTSRRVTGSQVRSFVLGGPVSIPDGVANYVSVSGGALGTTPTLATTSSGSDVGLRLQSKGQGRTSLTNNLGTLFSAGPNGAITPVNNVLAIATATNSAPSLIAEGSDTNIGLSLGTKGSGFMLLSMGAGGVLQLSPGGSEKMRVDASGNVGIGTSAPVYRIEAASSVNGNDGFLYKNNSTSALAQASLTVATSGASGISVGQYYSSKVAYFALGDNAGISFSISGTERAAITSTGNLQFNSGYGSVATAFGCRAWVNFNGTGTVAIRASGNVSSITDNGVGYYAVNFATAMPDANYSYSHSYSNEVNVQHGVGFLDGISASSLSLGHYNTANSTNTVDKTTVLVAVFR